MAEPLPPGADEPADIFEFSASAIKTARLCEYKYGFKYIDGIEAPSGAGAALGTRCHSELEEWLLKGTVPEIPAAKRLLPLLPSPAHPNLKVELPFRMLLGSGAARGFIDLLIPSPDLKFMPAGDWSPHRPVVIDHKTTSNMPKALADLDLLTDPQALLYGLVARKDAYEATGLRPEEVDLVWNYSATKSPVGTQPVKLRQTLTILEDGMVPLLADVAKMAAAKKANNKDGLDHDLRGCEEFGGCPYRPRCHHYQRYALRVAFGGEYEADLETTAAPLVAAASVTTTSPAANSAPSSTTSEKTLPSSALLAKLRASSATAPLLTTSLPAAVDKGEPAPTVDSESTVKPSVEPTLPIVDVSGLNEPLAPGSSPINPPDAVANTSPTEPPPPPQPEAKVSKSKRSRPTKVTTPTKTATTAERTVVTEDDLFSVSERIQSLASSAIDRSDFETAEAAITLLKSMHAFGGY